MAGDIFGKERAIVTLTSTGSSLTNSNGVAVGTDLDFRSAGNFAQDFQIQFELLCQWATITGIVNGTVIGDLYLVPKMDGTNLPDVDTTVNNGIPPTCYVGSFPCIKAPTANTNMRFVSNLVTVLHPMLYTAYLVNRSGQTITANWTMKAISARGQYT